MSRIWVIVAVVASGFDEKQLKPPPYLDCSNHPEYSDFRERFVEFQLKHSSRQLISAQEFHEDVQGILNTANDLGRRHEAVFTQWASSWDVFHLRTNHVTGKPNLPEELTKDFCFYGFAVVQWLGLFGKQYYDSVTGMNEWARNARGFLNDASKFNAMHFLESSGWPVRLAEMASLISSSHVGHDGYRPSRDAGLIANFRGSVRVAPEHTKTPGARKVRAVAISYHTALIREPLSLWRRALRHLFEIDITVHVLDPSATTSQDVGRLHSHCKFEEGAACASDERLLVLNELVESVLLSCHSGDHKARHHFITDAQAYYDLFVQSMGGDPELRGADVLLCGEPVYFCRLLSFFGKAVVGYISTPLSVMVQEKDRPVWYQQFYDMALDPRHTFAVTTPIFREWITYATGIDLPVVQPVCLYTDAVYFPTRENEVLIIKTVSLFWDSYCVLNYFAQQAAAADSQNGSMVNRIRFLESNHLSETERIGYVAFSEFSAAVLFPYAFSQFWFYELYAMGVPMYLPAKDTLPLYVNQDYAVCPDFEGHRPNHSPLQVHPYSPFDKDDFAAMTYWTQFTDYIQFKHLEYFFSVPDLLTKLAKADHRSRSRQMLQAHHEHLGVATVFWQRVLEQVATLSGKPAEYADNISEFSASFAKADNVVLSDELRDLSTRQPCGGTPSRSDGVCSMANDGDTRQKHPLEYHADPAYCREGSFWWVRLRRSAIDPEVKIWTRDCCCGSFGYRLWIRIGNSTNNELALECASLDIKDGMISSIVCPGEGQYIFVEARIVGGYDYFDEGISILMLPEVRVLSRDGMNKKTWSAWMGPSHV